MHPAGAPGGELVWTKCYLAGWVDSLSVWQTTVPEAAPWFKCEAGIPVSAAGMPDLSNQQATLFKTE